MKNKNNQKGFTLVELLVTISIITIAFLGFLFIIYRQLNLVSLSYHQLIAAYLAQEGTEIIKNIRDSNYLEKLQGTTGSWTNWDEGVGTDCAGLVCCYEGGINILGVEDPTLTKIKEGTCQFEDLRFLRYDGSLYQYDSGNFTIFKRGIEIEKDPTNLDVKLVRIKVFWQIKNKVYSFYPLHQTLYNWLSY